MRPWRSTWVASTTSSPAPELASMPRCVRCQSLATPSFALYWHIGDTTMRFGSVRSASFIGENNALGIGRHMRLEERKFKRPWRRFGSCRLAITRLDKGLAALSPAPQIGAGTVAKSAAALRRRPANPPCGRGRSSNSPLSRFGCPLGSLPCRMAICSVTGSPASNAQRLRRSSILRISSRNFACV